MSNDTIKTRIGTFPLYMDDPFSRTLTNDLDRVKVHGLAWLVHSKPPRGIPNSRLEMPLWVVGASADGFLYVTTRARRVDGDGTYIVPGSAAQRILLTSIAESHPIEIDYGAEISGDALRAFIDGLQPFGTNPFSMDKIRGIKDVPIAGLGLIVYKSASEALPTSRVEEPLLVVGASSDRKVFYASSDAMRKISDGAYWIHGKHTQAIPVKAVAGYIPLTKISG